MGIFRKAMMGVIKSLTPQATQQPKVSRTPLKSSLEEVLYEIQHRLGHSNDVIVRRLSLDASSDPDIALIYTEGLANTKDILVSLLVDLQKIHPEISRYPKDQQLQLLKKTAFCVRVIFTILQIMSRLFPHCFPAIRSSC